MNTVCLNGNWTLVGISPDGKKIEMDGEVPGSAIGAIVKSGADGTGDVFWRDNAKKYQKYETYDWVYSKKFTVHDISENAFIVFNGIDTYGDIYINGKYAGSCDNGFIPHRFEVGTLLSEGENEIEVYVSSPINYTKGKKPRPCAFASYERLYTRRPQFTYGWDWAMRFVTCGITGDVFIENSDELFNIKDVYIYTDCLDQDSASVGIEVECVNFFNGAVLDFEIFDQSGKLVYKTSTYCEEEFLKIVVDIKNPECWYPLGYGDQPLYRLEIKTVQKCLYSTSFGIRTVKIEEITDEAGSDHYYKCLELKKTPFSTHYDKNETFSGFVVKINGTKVMCKGANWVPCEVFACGKTDKKVTKLLELAADAGVNMLRVWGGGSFETEHFYNECSRLGIMVTQDFLMACGTYPEDEHWFLEHLKKEAEYIVGLIRNKACLVWWSGDNENAVDGCDTDRYYQGRTSACKAIAPVIYKKDPRRRFLKSSPYGGKNYASNTVGTTHNTQFLSSLFRYIEQENAEDYKDFLKLYNARFIAEEPCLGTVSELTLKKFMTNDDIYGVDLGMWLYHTQSNPALSKEIFEYIVLFSEKLFGKFKDGKDRVFKTIYLQYEWIRVSLERARREKWFCSGIIYWMLNDCWPAAAGWAMIDYYGLPKASYYSFKRGAKQVVMSIDLEDGIYKFYICNDGKSEKLALKWYAVTSDGEVGYESETKIVYAEENASAVVFEMNEADLTEGCFMVTDIIGEGDISDRAFYRKGNLEIISCPDRVDLLKADGGYVTVKAKKYVHAVELCGDAIFAENYFHMLPGEQKTIQYTKMSETDIWVNAYTI